MCHCPGAWGAVSILMDAHAGRNPGNLSRWTCQGEHLWFPRSGSRRTPPGVQPVQDHTSGELRASDSSPVLFLFRVLQSPQHSPRVPASLFLLTGQEWSLNHCRSLYVLPKDSVHPLFIVHLPMPQAGVHGLLLLPTPHHHSLMLPPFGSLL